MSFQKVTYVRCCSRQGHLQLLTDSTLRSNMRHSVFPSTSHEFQRDGITICTTFTPFKPENARLLVMKNDIIIDIRVMYDHIKGTTLILSKNISLLVTIKGV